MLKHIDASAMMDLLLRLISCVEPASLRQEVLHVSNFFAVMCELLFCFSNFISFLVAERREVGPKTLRTHQYW